MIEEKELLKLAITSKKESKQIDFKEKFDPSSTSDWCEIIKDVIAMANSGGGVILFGIKDDSSHSSFNKKIVLDLDPVTLSDKIHAYTNENFSDFKIREINIKNKKIATFVVFGAPTPIAFTRNGVDVIIKNKQKRAFTKGSVYFRHGAKSEPGDTNDIKRALDKIVNDIRKNWFKGVRQISKIRVNEEVIVKSKDLINSSGQAFSIADLQKISEQGKPVTLTLEKFKKLQKEYPFEYKDVLRACKKKKPTSQKKLQAYIDKCKENQNLSINWRTVIKSLGLPFSVSNKYMYKEKVISDF